MLGKQKRAVRQWIERERVGRDSHGGRIGADLRG